MGFLPALFVRQFLLLSFLLAVAPVTDAPRFRMVTGATYEGAVWICEASSAMKQSCWQPSEAEIAALEAAMSESANARQGPGLAGLLFPLPEYRRQYLGVLHGTERSIMVTGYHMKQEVVTSGKWLRSVVTVNGGGGRFFHGSYSPQRHTFEFLSINAPD